MKKRPPKKSYGFKKTHIYEGIPYAIYNQRWIYLTKNTKYNVLRCGYCMNYDRCLGKKLTTFNAHYCQQAKNEFKHRLV